MTYSIICLIIHRSGLHPPLYTVTEKDLQPVSNINLLFKYADNTNLLVPQFNDIEAETEILNIKAWADDNKIDINWDKM